MKPKAVPPFVEPFGFISLGTANLGVLCTLRSYGCLARYDESAPLMPLTLARPKTLSAILLTTSAPSTAPIQPLAGQRTSVPALLTEVALR